jgi:hypothetical protein
VQQFRSEPAGLVLAAIAVGWNAALLLIERGRRKRVPESSH